MVTNEGIYFVTGSDDNFFENSKLLIASWKRNNPEFPLIYCDFGLTELQLKIMSQIPCLKIASSPIKRDGWLGKAYLLDYLNRTVLKWKIIIWIDSDALIINKLPDIAKLMEGYDILVDAHELSVGEVTPFENIKKLGLTSTDSYFSAGFWISNNKRFLETYANFAEEVKYQGPLWEGNAFVAAIYKEKLKVRTINGNIWHCRGMTSLPFCTVKNGNVYYKDFPIYILHANYFYKTKADGRRVLKRPELAAIQDYYEKYFLDNFMK